MIISLTEKDDNDGEGTTWDVGMVANLPKDAAEHENGDWDRGKIGLVLINHGFAMLSQFYKAKKTEEAQAAHEAEKKRGPKLLLPPGHHC